MPGLQILPQTRPDPARFPAPESHVNRMPVAQFRRQVPPRTARALKIKQQTPGRSFVRVPPPANAWLLLLLPPIPSMPYH